MDEVEQRAFALLRRKIRAKMNDLQDALVQQVLPQQDYALIVGKIHGLSLAEQDLIDLQNEAANKDD